MNADKTTLPKPGDLHEGFIVVNLVTGHSYGPGGLLPFLLGVVTAAESLTRFVINDAIQLFASHGDAMAASVAHDYYHEDGYRIIGVQARIKSVRDAPLTNNSNSLDGDNPDFPVGLLVDPVTKEAHLRSSLMHHDGPTIYGGHGIGVKKIGGGS